MLTVKNTDAGIGRALFIKINNDIPFVELKLWIAAIQTLSGEEILSMDRDKDDINTLLKAIRKGIETDHPALEGLEDVFILDKFAQFKKASQVEEAVTQRIFSKCEPLLNLTGK